MTIVKTDRNVVKFEPSLIQKISDSPAMFVLTGSRSFKGAVIQENTDWDFFVNELLISHDLLESWGFSVTGDDCYVDDPTLARVYRAVCPVTNVQIDIQVIPDDFFEIKLEAQKIIEEFFEGSRVYDLAGVRRTSRRLYSDHSKETRRGLWEIAVFMASRR